MSATFASPPPHGPPKKKGPQMWKKLVQVRSGKEWKESQKTLKEPFEANFCWKRKPLETKNNWRPGYGGVKSPKIRGGVKFSIFGGP